MLWASIGLSDATYFRQKSGIWGFRSDKVEKVNGVDTKVFTATGVEMVTRTRVEHLPEHLKKKSSGGWGHASGQGLTVGVVPGGRGTTVGTSWVGHVLDVCAPKVRPTPHLCCTVRMVRCVPCSISICFFLPPHRQVHHTHPLPLRPCSGPAGQCTPTCCHHHHTHTPTHPLQLPRAHHTGIFQSSKGSRSI